MDDELPAPEAMAVRSHLEECPACRGEYDALRATSAVLRRHLPPMQAPDLLRSRVAAALRDARAAELAPAPRARRSIWLRQIAAGLLIAAASSAVTRAILRRSDIGTSVAVSDVVATHVRALMAHQLTAVISSDEHNVKPWFDGRVPFAPDVPRLDGAGFPLVGGRVDTVGHTPVAALVYGRRQHVINLFTWPAGPAAGTAEGAGNTERGYNVLRWTRGDMQFAAVSDLAMPDLREFVKEFRQGALAAGSERPQPEK